MVGFTFSGQGAQAPQMGRGWVDDAAWRLVEQAARVSGRDVAALLLDADADELRLTRNAQLAILVMSLMADDALRRAGAAPTACLGHSVGEYAALISAGALDFDDGVRLVFERAEAMQAADELRPGAMTAIVGLDDDDAAAACSRADGDVWVANFNGPGHTVVAGSPGAVAAAEAAALDMGAARTVRLDVGGAYHTPFMTPARDRLRAALAQAAWRTPAIPVIANVDGRAHTAPDEWQALLSAQLCSPVRWSQSIRRAAADVAAFVLIGPQPSLAVLVEQSAPHCRVLTVRDPGDVETAVAALDRLAARLDDGDHLVTSPASGVYQTMPPAGAITTCGEIVAEGDVVGLVDGQPVRSPVAGWLMGLLAAEGQRVRKGQPLARLRLL